MSDSPHGPSLVLQLSGSGRSQLKIPLVPLRPAAGQDGDLRIVRAPDLGSWTATVRASQDPCLLLDAAGRVAAASAGALGSLLVQDAERDVVGKHVAEVLALTDFQPLPGDIGGTLDHLPPLLALASGGLSRGLLRLRGPGDRLLTVDMVAAALHDADGALAGVIAFAYPISD